jgi:hypothetical protein
MKTSKAILFLFIVSISFSCNNKNDAFPDDLEGDWVYITEGDGEIPTQSLTYVFKKSDESTGEFEFIWSFKINNEGEFVTIAAIAGTMLVDSAGIHTTTQKAGSQQDEPLSDTFNDEITWYSPGDPMYEKFPKEAHYGFEFEDDLLVLKEDFNRDGDSDDRGEHTKYSRKK